MPSLIAIQVSLQVKEAFEHEIAAQTVEQNDAMIRIGLEAVRMLRNVHVNSDIDALKQTYERQLEWKDQEHEVLVKVLRQQEEEEIQRRVVHCNEQMKSLQEQTMHWKERVSELETAAASYRDNLLNAERHQYRLIDELRQQARETQEAHHRTHQEELMKCKEHIVQLTEELKTNEAMSAIRIQQDVRNEVENQQQEQERRYQGLQEQLGTVQEHNNTLKHELERWKDEYKSLEKVSELSLKQVANELEVKFLQQQAQEKQRFDDELVQVRAKLADMEAQKLEAVKQENAALKAKETSKRHSSQALGTIGEQYFVELAERTFCTYDGYEIEDKTRVGHSGDFFLNFANCGTILVDVKNFDVSRISTTDVTKFKYDLTRNSSIRIGWLVSLNGYICNYNQKPYVFEIEDGRLLVFINNLKHVADPEGMLQSILYMSMFMYHQMLNVESNVAIIHNYKRFEKRVKDSVADLQKSWKKTLSTMNQMREDVLDHERHLKNMLFDDLMSIRDEHATTIQEWWDAHVVRKDGGKLKSNELQAHFEKTKGPTTIKSDQFKTILKTLVSAEQLQIPKMDKSQITVTGYALKEQS